MEDWRKALKPYDMTPKERLEKIVDLLVTASIRLVEEKTKSEKPEK
jgi:hypothetical protein